MKLHRCNYRIVDTEHDVNDWFYFTWDSLKAESNLRKYGVRLEDAATVFDDPSATTFKAHREWRAALADVRDVRCAASDGGSRDPCA